jgi:hypothetical protein
MRIDCFVFPSHQHMIDRLKACRLIVEVGAHCELMSLDVGAFDNMANLTLIEVDGGAPRRSSV